VPGNHPSKTSNLRKTLCKSSAASRRLPIINRDRGDRIDRTAYLVRIAFTNDVVWTRRPLPKRLTTSVPREANFRCLSSRHQLARNATLRHQSHSSAHPLMSVEQSVTGCDRLAFPENSDPKRGNNRESESLATIPQQATAIRLFGLDRRSAHAGRHDRHIRKGYRRRKLCLHD
jgi:hypothetical protein